MLLAWLSVRFFMEAARLTLTVLPDGSGVALVGIAGGSEPFIKLIMETTLSDFLKDKIKKFKMQNLQTSFHTCQMQNLQNTISH